MLEVQNCHLRQFHATRNAMTTTAAKILSWEMQKKKFPSYYLHNMMNFMHGFSRLM